MTQKEVAEIFRSVFESEIMSLREAGQKEYAHKKDNAFRNFENIANYLDLTREKVLLTYAVKHMDGIVAYVNGHKSQREDVRGRINDLIVYMLLLRAMLEENTTNGTHVPSIEPYESTLTAQVEKLKDERDE